MLGDLSKTVKYVVGSYQNNKANSYERGRRALLNLALLGLVVVGLGMHFGFATPSDLFKLTAFSALIGILDFSLLMDFALLVDTFTSGIFGLIGLGICGSIIAFVGAVLSGKDYLLGIREE